MYLIQKKGQIKGTKQLGPRYASRYCQKSSLHDCETICEEQQEWIFKQFCSMNTWLERHLYITTLKVKCLLYYYGAVMTTYLYTVCVTEKILFLDSGRNANHSILIMNDHVKVGSFPPYSMKFIFLDICETIQGVKCKFSKMFLLPVQV